LEKDVRLYSIKGVAAMLVFAIATLLAGAANSGERHVEYGLAAGYAGDMRIEENPAVIAATRFETADWARDAFDHVRALNPGYEHTTDPTIALESRGSLQIQQRMGTHQPREFNTPLPESDTVYVRWYRRWEAGYDWTQHKMPGVSAKASSTQDGTAGVKPTGCDKFAAKLFVDWDTRPAFYAYHLDQKDGYGDHFEQNIGTPVILETDRWYGFEMMLKSNTPGQRDGELKMWIDGVLKAHIQGLRFRTCDSLKINEFNHSAYVGGSWTSKRDQKLWDDNLVIAREYIGPMVQRPDPHADGPEASEGGRGRGCFIASLARLWKP
jgi:hypothetical protein